MYGKMIYSNDMVKKIKLLKKKVANRIYFKHICGPSQLPLNTFYVEKPAL